MFRFSVVLFCLVSHVVWGQGRSGTGVSPFVSVANQDSAHLAWAETFSSSEDYHHDQPVAMAIDSAGSAYIVTISQIGLRPKRGFGVMKVDRFGRKLWVDLLGRWHDEPCCVAIEPDGMLYVAGSMFTGEIDGQSNVHRNYFTAGIHPASGRVIWQDTLDGRSRDDIAKALAMDPDGNVVVTGWSDGRVSGWDFVTVKYTPEGRMLWRRRYDGPPVVLPGYTASANDEPGTLKVDSAGNVFVAGSSGLGLAAVKYSPDGNQLWTASYELPGTEGVGVGVIDLLPDGGLIMTGVLYQGPSGSDQDVLTLRFDPSGNLAWSHRWSGTIRREERPVAMKLTEQKEAYVLVESVGDSTGSDYVLLKYSPSGGLEWERRFDSGPEQMWQGYPADDLPSALTLDRTGNVYITGTRRGRFVSDGDIWTIKLDSRGRVQWDMVSPFNFVQPEARLIEVEPSGDVYVLGSVKASRAEEYSYTRPVLIRYLQGEPSNEPIPSLPPPRSHLFPIPATNVVTLEYVLTAPAYVTLHLFDIVGRDLGLFGEDDSDGGVHRMIFDVGNLPSGVYVYRLDAGSSRYTGRLVVTR